MGLTKVVDFSTAKLLKEKGKRILPDFESSYPTIAEVVMWLYEKHNLWVEVYPRKYNIMKLMWSYSIVAIKEGYTLDMEFPDIERIEEIPTWEEPTEAYENAIEYVLNNLI
jgi:hypothetical protein